MKKLLVITAMALMCMGVHAAPPVYGPFKTIAFTNDFSEFEPALSKFQQQRGLLYPPTMPPDAAEKLLPELNSYFGRALEQDELDDIGYKLESCYRGLGFNVQSIRAKIRKDVVLYFIGIQPVDQDTAAQDGYSFKARQPQAPQAVVAGGRSTAATTSMPALAVKVDQSITMIQDLANRLERTRIDIDKQATSLERQMIDSFKIINELKSRVDAVEKSGGAAPDIAAMKTKLEALEASFREKAGSVLVSDPEVNLKIKTIDEKTAAVSKDVKKVDERVDRVETRVERVDTKVDAVEQNIKHEVADIRDDVKRISNRIVLIEHNVGLPSSTASSSSTPGARPNVETAASQVPPHSNEPPPSTPEEAQQLAGSYRSFVFVKTERVVINDPKERAEIPSGFHMNVPSLKFKERELAQIWSLAINHPTTISDIKSYAVRTQELCNRNGLSCKMVAVPQASDGVLFVVVETEKLLQSFINP